MIQQNKSSKNTQRAQRFFKLSLQVLINLCGSKKRLSILLLILILAACGSETAPPPTLIATAGPVQTFTPVPTASPTLPSSPTPMPTTAVPTATPVLQYPTETPLPSSTPPPTATTMALAEEQVIGMSVEERPLIAYQFKNGPNQVVFVGGMHGGYEWNTTALAYEAIDYFTNNPDTIPDSVTLTIIPTINVDGLAQVAEIANTIEVDEVAELPLEELLPARFNANNVDLNRNWDCKWHKSAYWRDQWVSGGPEPFSEPEVISLRDFLLEKSPEVVVFWHSAADGVFASGCGELFEPSLTAANVYGLAAGYPVYEAFELYLITGDAGDWLSEQDIPAITVELKDHTSTDLLENLEGMRALLDSFR